MTRLPENAIRLYHRGTPTGHDLYPATAERVPRTQTGTWERRVVTGPVSADAETFLSSWTQDDYSGGFGIKDANETTDTSRIAFGVIDGRRPKSMCLPPLTRELALWTPAELGASLVAWYDADDLDLADGASVAVWTDKSGNGRHLTQTTAAARPTLQTGEQNDLPVVRFDGTDDFLERAGSLGITAQPFAFAGAYKITSNQTRVWTSKVGPAAVMRETGTFEHFAGSFQNYGAADANFNVHAVLFNGASSLGTLNGTSTATNPGANAPDATGIYVGANDTGTSLFPAMDAGELVFVSGAISAANRQKLEGYLAWRWGRQAGLAGGHPYLNGPPTLPTGVGSAWPLGDIGTQFYVAWPNGIVGWNHGSGAWHATLNAWPGGNTTGPVGEAVPFGGYLFVPCGAENLAILSENVAATGTLTTAEVGITARELALHDGKLFAIDTNNELWQLTPLGAIAGPSNIANWTQVEDAFGNDLTLDTGLTPTRLVNWFNAAQEETLWCVTQAQGAYLLNIDEPRWVKHALKEGAHPDWGNDAEVFREGEDLFIAGGGLDLTRLTTANVEVPVSGPSKDQGVPPAYASGTIVDLCADRSSLYALVKAGTSRAASSSSVFALQSTVGQQGTGTGQFGNPDQVAVDSSGNVYVADLNNHRVQKFNSSGVYQASFSVFSPYGVAVDSSGNVYVAASFSRLVKFNSAGVAQWDTGNIAAGLTFGHLCTDGTHLFVAAKDEHKVYKRLCSTGAAVTNWGSNGSGNGQFSSPVGICMDATHVYVADTGNDRVQKFDLTGAYVTQWGSSGAGDGQFTEARGLCTDDSGDVWVADYGNSRLQRFSNTGTFQTSFVVSSPRGVGRATGDVLWVAQGNHVLTKWDEGTETITAIDAKTWLGAWTGTAWCALWEAGDDVVPTWMRVSMKGDHALWWGDTRGRVYRQLLPPPFFNPAARIELGVYPFAESAWMETVRYDANMSGWDKIASHFFAMLDYAAADVYVDISYRTDADQFDSGLLDPPYRSWKRVDHIGRTLLWFDDAEDDAISGLPWHEGEPFQWIQFRYDFKRGTNTFKSPVWMWHSLHHLAVPQDTASFVLKIPLKPFKWKTYNRSPDEMAATLFGLQTERAMMHLQTSNPRDNHPEWQVFFRGRVTQVKAEQYVGADNNIAEVVVVNFVELEASSNEHTTVASDTP